MQCDSLKKMISKILAKTILKYYQQDSRKEQLLHWVNNQFLNFMVRKTEVLDPKTPSLRDEKLTERLTERFDHGLGRKLQKD